MDAIEEVLHDEQIDELIIATTPHHIEGWLHVDLPHRAAHLGLPVTALDRRPRCCTSPTPHAHRHFGPSLGRRMLNKVPEVTFFFWLIKIMCTTVGETAADYLNENLGFGLTNTTIVTGVLLIVLLVVQFRANRYIPSVYWSVVVVISVFGTLITDNMTDRYNVPLTTSTPIFAVILAIVFAVWWYFERTLSIHTIFTTRREALLLARDPVHVRARHRRRRPRRGEVQPRLRRLDRDLRRRDRADHDRPLRASRLNAVLTFWLAYIMTRPLGASIGDFMSQHSHKYGGLGLGTTGTSYIFLGCILALVVWLTITRRDATEVREAASA